MAQALQKVGFFAPRSGKTATRAQETLQSMFEQAGIASYEIKKFDSLRRPIIEEGTDLALCLGGDGTMLSLVSQVVTGDCILGGINMGHLGFLSACSRGEYEQLGQCLIDASYGISPRTVLEVTQLNADGEQEKGPLHALNEVSLMRAQTGKMIDVSVFLNGEKFNRYHSDGILVSTPTGSSAYSLSAGGPLIWPDSNVMCLTPVCPHSLTGRSVVMPDHVEITLLPRERRGRAHEQMIYSMDGRMVHPIKLSSKLVIKKSPKQLRLLRLPGTNFAARLRSKLGW